MISENDITNSLNDKSRKELNKFDEDKISCLNIEKTINNQILIGSENITPMKEIVKNVYDSYKNEFNFRLKPSKIDILIPKIYKSPFQIFHQENFSSFQINYKCAREKWNQLNEVEKSIYDQKSRYDIIRFNKEWKTYLEKYINLIYRKKKTNEEKQIIVNNIINLNHKYGKKYVFREISQIISIMNIFKLNYDKKLRVCLRKKKIVSLWKKNK